MKIYHHGISAAALLLLLMLPVQSSACGGFFCQLVPINQAAEQIVFRQDGDQITAMVQIQFQGNAEDFSWVVPVPATPTFDVGSNTAFTDLEIATRPQFNLTRSGQECVIDQDFEQLPVASEGGVVPDSDDSGVVVEDVQDVGGYEVTVISGDNAESISQWLIDNGYDLTATGEELLAPYVEEQMKFVAVKLQQNRGLGSIQPLILKYQSDKPVVPIRLTAVAALEDMGVLIWLLGDSRAVPENFLHVTPNYTRLNWFAGTRNAYGSYQSLITDAMNEAGGQGFATDFAGRINNLLESITAPGDIREQLNRLSGSSDVEFLALSQTFVNDPIVFDTLTETLPLPDGQPAFAYFDQSFLANNYTSAELAAARTAVTAAIETDVLLPLQLSLDVLAGDRYMTRLFTTLSADEMTLDPAFVFNDDMGDQQLDRNANLEVRCIDDRNHWTLKLGEGTGRTDEVVIDTIGPIPFAAPAIDQEASWRVEETAEFGQPNVVNQRVFQVASLGSPGTGINDTAVAECIDTDGDGYGWNGVETCFPDSVDPNAGNNDVTNGGACLDSDGDGYGWNGVETCIPNAVDENPNNSVSESACVDSDGDGYGWNGTSTCIPANNTGSLECIDTDGDGYGWTGTQSCRLDEEGRIILL